MIRFEASGPAPSPEWTILTRCARTDAGYRGNRWGQTPSRFAGCECASRIERRAFGSSRQLDTSRRGYTRGRYFVGFEISGRPNLPDSPASSRQISSAGPLATVSAALQLSATVISSRSTWGLSPFPAQVQAPTDAAKSTIC